MKKNQSKNVAGAKTLAANDTVVYCGPDIRNVVKQFTVFQGDLPVMVKDQIDKTPLIGKLVVPVTELSRMRKSMVETGTPENIWYNKILSGGDE